MTRVPAVYIPPCGHQPQAAFRFVSSVFRRREQIKQSGNVQYENDMATTHDDTAFRRLTVLLRAALGAGGLPIEGYSDEEWAAVHRLAQEQTVTGVAWQAVKQLTADQRPPLELLLTWAAEAERIIGMNRRLDEACRQLTALFASQGRRSAILKGQANARLYPEPLSRQPGDVDIWVEGGRKSVLRMLDQMGLAYMACYHHAHLNEPLYGAIVEVHFRPSSGNYNPVTNSRLQRELEAEILRSEMTTEGFAVPTLRFALLMQLAHIQRHYLGGGIGLRHLIDYMLLLRAGRGGITEEELRRLGLLRFGGAVMWLLGELFALEHGQMLCKPDELRGRLLLADIEEGGNFGRHKASQQYGVFRRRLKHELRTWSLMRAWGSEMGSEMAWLDLKFCQRFIMTIPERIRLRSWSLNSGKIEK